MAYPTIAVEMAITTRPTETATWVDITSFVYGASIRRGRQHELDRTEAGTCRLALDNTDRRFDPTYQGAIVNLCTNPSIETDATGYVAVGGGDVTVIQATVSDSLYGNNCLRLQGSTVDEKDARYAFTFTPGTQYTVSAYFSVQYAPIGAFGSLQCVPGGGTGGSTALDYTLIDQWQRVSVTFTADGDGSAGYIDAPRSRVVGATRIYMDGLQIETAAAATTYADGTQDNCRWAGTAHASQTYRGGPYYGDLKIRRRVRVRATWDSVTYDVFHGFIEAYPPRWPTLTYGTVEILTADGFSVLAKRKLNDSYVEQLSGARINAVLDAASWTGGSVWIVGSSVNGILGTTTIVGPNGDRSIGDGITTIQAATLSDTPALQHIQDVTQTEFGLVFVRKDGVFRFIDRHFRLKPPNQTSLATFGDLLTELNYTDLEPSYDDQRLYNDIRMKNTGGTVQTASDATSQLDYFPTTLAEESLLGTSDIEAKARANWLLSRYKDPHWRVVGIAFEEGDDDMWPQILGRELNDRITVNRRPQGGTVTTGDYHIEGIEHEIEPGQAWRMRWSLSPADPTKYWHVSDGIDQYAAYAVLGTTTVPAY